jgi:hypothetical protein
MKHLKRFDERLGIIKDIEEQVELYMRTIESKPISKTFKFFYHCDLGTYPFRLVIDSKLDSRGYFTNINEDFYIYIKERDDESTLLHEVKHLDFFLRNKNIKNPYVKSQIAISMDGKNAKVSQRTLDILEHIFYIYDENEFQSKYHSFYKDFDIMISKLKLELTNKGESNLLTTKGIRHIFYNERWWSDATFTWYVTKEGKEFKFSDYVDKDELRIVFYYILMEQKRKTFSNMYLDVFSYIAHNIVKDMKRFFKIFTKKERQEIEKYINFFEKDINKKLIKYRRRMSRIVTLACEKYCE